MNLVVAFCKIGAFSFCCMLSLRSSLEEAGADEFDSREYFWEGAKKDHLDFSIVLVYSEVVKKTEKEDTGNYE